MRSYLVVANETLLDDALLEAVRAKKAAGDSRFHLLVPASHPKGQWTEGSIRAVAEERLQEGIRHFRGNGIEVTGEVGDSNPVHAVGDVVIREPFDEVIISTLPPGPSHWLRQDAPTRIRRVLGIPVTHVSRARTPALSG